MEKWPQVTVAIVPIVVQGTALHVALDVGVDPGDIERLRDGSARAEGDFVIFAGPACRYILSYRVQETGQHGRAGRGDGVLRPRQTCMIGIDAPHTPGSGLGED